MHGRRTGADQTRMMVLDRVRNAMQRPEKPLADVTQMARLRTAAYTKLFEESPKQVIVHDEFGRQPNLGGRIHVHRYDMSIAGSEGQPDRAFEVIVTDGLSDYGMRDPESGQVIRRELIQYVPQATVENLARLHYSAWVPLAARFCLDYFQTMGPYQDRWAGALTMPPIVDDHAEFELKLPGGGEPMKLMWLVPLTQAEVDYKVRHGVEALIGRMEDVNLPWIFDPANRPGLV